MIKSLVPHLLLLLLAASGYAATIPASEDSFAYRGRITSAAGKAAGLPVSSSKSALLRFDLPSNIHATHVQSARLRLYATRVAKAGGLQIRRIESDWTEDATRVAPSIGAVPFGDPQNLTVDRSKRFVYFDVTEAVRSWLVDPESNHGLAIVTLDGNILLGAKEGSGSGYPAEIEIEVNSVLPLFTGGDPLSGSIKGSAIEPGSVGSLQLGNGSVLAANLGTGVIHAGAIAGDAIDGSKVADGSLTGGDLHDESVPVGKIQFQGAIFWEQQPGNVNGGSSVANTWQQRTLNAETNLSGGSITRSASTITLQPGVYYVRGSCPAAISSNHQAALRDVTGPSPTVAILGTSEHCTTITSPGYQTRSFIEGYLSVDGTARNYQIWHFVRTNTFSSNPQPWVFGVSNVTQPTNNEEPSIYSQINFIKLK